ncbi:hypothetical protein NT04LM_2505, partial [Listeria monocytogenes FSL F2-208]
KCAFLFLLLQSLCLPLVAYPIFPPPVSLIIAEIAPI